MDTYRRQFLALAGFGSAALLPTRPSLAATEGARAPASVSELLAAGLDPFVTYARMFASLTPGDECAWWFMGALPLEIEDIGAVEFMQEETIRVHHAEVPGKGQLDILWAEAGVFRDINTGGVPKDWYNPIKGALQPQNGTLRGGPSRHRIRKRGDEIDIELQVANTSASRITLDGRVAGDRVCLTHIEEKSRTDRNGAAPSIIRTVFKIYASLQDLKGPAPSVSASGFYGVRNLATGRVFVNGLMHKTSLDDKLNPLAWERVKARYPDFFAGERLASLGA